MKVNIGKLTEVTVIAADGQILRSVNLVRKHGGQFELRWAKSTEPGDKKWIAFASSCGITAGGEEIGGGKTCVAGVNSSGVVFYRLRVPQAKQTEMSEMIRFQLESRLPLPREQLEFAWSVCGSQDGQVDVCAGVSRRDAMQRLVDEIRGAGCKQIFLDCDGTVKAWNTFFGEGQNKALLVSVEATSTKICLVEKGSLINATNLAIGAEDFSTEGGQAENRFGLEVRDAMKVLAGGDIVPVWLFCQADSKRQEMLASLEAAGLMVKVCDFEGDDAKSIIAGADSRTLAEYYVAIGIGLLALDGASGQIDLFARLYRVDEGEAKKRWFYSLKLASVILAAVIVLLAAASYCSDVGAAKRWNEVQSKAGLEQLKEKQRLVKVIKFNRPDLLAFLSKINGVEAQGIRLDSFEYKKTGQQVKISGMADGEEQLSNFQKKLRELKDIKEPIKEDLSKDKKEGKLKFTLTFGYVQKQKAKGGG